MDGKTEEINLTEIQPSELYLSSDRLRSLKESDVELEPLPVKEIGDRLFFTDGHHRAFTLMKKGREKIKIQREEKELGWLEYLICVDWCEKEGIEEISDLKNRIVKEETFKEKWIGKCQEMHQKVDDDIFEHFIEFEEVDEKDIMSDICETVLRSLPQYFGIEKAVKDFVKGVQDKYFLSVQIGKIPVGFASLKEHNEFTSELYVIGLVEELHRNGIGKKLMEKVERYLSEQGKKYLTVKTLGPSREDDEPYNKTRNFYRAVGFVPLEDFESLWDEENPCLFMVKAIDT